MRKKRDHRPKKGDSEIRALPESSRGGDDVVRLRSGSEEAEEQVERLEVERPRRVNRRLAVGSRTELAVDAKPDLPEVDGPAEAEVEDLEAVWEGGRRKLPQVPIGWIVVVIGFAVSVLVVALWKIPKGDSNLERKAAKVSEKLNVERQQQVEAEKLAEQIQMVASRYLAAETVEEKLKYVRMPARVRPLMEDYYRSNQLVPMRAGGFYVFEPFALSKYPFFILEMMLIDGGTVRLLLEEDEEGRVLVDWETHVAYQTMSLDEFVEERPEEGVEFRVLVEYDEYYAFEFSDSDRYVSLMIKERDEPGFLFGYVERYSDVHDRLIEVLGKEAGVKKPMILRVKFLPGSRGIRSVMVEEVVSPAWALIAEPEGE